MLCHQTSTTCTARKPLFHDLNGSCESYDSCQAIDGSYLFDSIGQGCLGWQVLQRPTNFAELLLL